ncbi:MAG: glycerate kinase [Phycisphaerae bacterium]|nr:glycerate kinase [Phycisphaerae bacterium]
MKVVIAPDSFKECLPAADVADALARGILEVAGDARVDLCPMADGGEGTVAAMVAATGGTTRTVDVWGPLGAAIRARFGLLGSDRTAGLPGELGLAGAVGRRDDGDEPARSPVVEMAAASGLTLVPSQRRDPLRTTTYGTGQLIAAALETGCEEIIVGVGGSATVDGGCGAAQALGVRFLDADGRELPPGINGSMLSAIAAIDLAGRDARLDAVTLRVACDVTNPLTGPEGAARVYAPQKGATPETVERLAEGLEHLAMMIRRETGRIVAGERGAGAAGGLAAGLAAITDATLEPGAALVADAVALPARLTGADLCLTGEGRLDAQTGAGKTAFAVARLARAASVPVVCIPGRADADAPDAFDAVRPLVAGDVAEHDALRDPAGWLARRAAEVVGDHAAGRL